MTPGITRYRGRGVAALIRPRLPRSIPASLLCVIVLSALHPGAAAQDVARPLSPPVPLRADTVIVGRGPAPSKIRIRSFRGQDIRIIRQSPHPGSREQAVSGSVSGVSKRDLDALEARLLRAIANRAAGPATVVMPERNPAQPPRPATARVETVYVERPAPDSQLAARPAAVDTGAVVPAIRDAKPAPPPPAPVTLVKEVERSILEKGLFTALDVIFEFNKSRLMKRSHVILNAIGQVLADHPEIDILIEGHTDSIGSAAYNLKLSGERASATRQYLLDNFPAIAADRISVAGLGLTRPVADNSNETGRALNRRVEFRVTEHRGR